jgi:hypothetical protein
MLVGRSLNCWLGRVPELAAILAAIGFGVPAYGQHSHPPSGGGAHHVSAPPPRPMVKQSPAQPSAHQSPQLQEAIPPQQARPPQQQPTAPTDVPKELGGERSTGGTPTNDGHVTDGGATGGQTTIGGGLASGTNVHPQVPHPPAMRRWPLPQGATESDRPPPGQCRVWLGGVPASRQPAPTSCGQAAKMRTPGSTLIFGDDKP